VVKFEIERQEFYSQIGRLPPKSGELEPLKMLI